MDKPETTDVTAMRAAIRGMARARKLDELSERLRARGCGELVVRANDVMDNVFTFNKTWDMERCCEPFVFDGADWNVVNNDDEEWCFMLNRMDYLVDLAAATLATGEPRYAARAWSLIDNWICAHPAIESELSTRTLDTGIRICTWAQVLPVLEHAGLLDDDALARVHRSINDQIVYLHERYIPKYETSNWGSIQALAIVYVLCTIEAAPADHPAWSWACERIESQMRAQVYPDGIDWEQSTMYHVEVLLNVLRSRWALLVRGIELPAGLDGTARAMARALCAQMMPTGDIDAQGDSDRCDVRGLLALCAALTDDGAVAAACGCATLDDQDLFEYGCPVEDALVGLSRSELPSTSFNGMDSGLFTARSSWDVRANWTLFSSGPLGSGHGHSDNLHVSCCYRGVPVLIDNGRYTYREDEPLRPALKAAPAHNVPLLDGISNCQPKGSWGYSDFAQPLKTYVRHSGNAGSAVHYWEGALVGHDPLHVLVRKLIALDCGIWFGCDETFADGDHELEARFHFDPACSLTALRSGEHGGHDSFAVSAPDVELLFGTTGSGRIESDRCSLGYNDLSDQALLRVTASVHQHGGMLWWLVPAGTLIEGVPVLRNLDTPVDPELAEAVRFTLPSGDRWTIAVFHGEVFSGVKVFGCEGVAFHAKTVAIHEREGCAELNVLRA